MTEAFLPLWAALARDDIDVALDGAGDEDVLLVKERPGRDASVGLEPLEALPPAWKAVVELELANAEGRPVPALCVDAGGTIVAVAVCSRTGKRRSPPVRTRVMSLKGPSLLQLVSGRKAAS